MVYITTCLFSREIMYVIYSDILSEADGTKQWRTEYHGRGVQHGGHSHLQHWVQDARRSTSQVSDLSRR